MNTLLALGMGATIGVGLAIGVAVAAVVFGLVFLLCILPELKKGKNKGREQPMTEEAEEAEEEHALEVLEEEIEEEEEENKPQEEAVEETVVEETVEEVAEEPRQEEAVEETVVEETVEEAPAEEVAEEQVEEAPAEEQPVEQKAKKEVAAAAAAEEEEDEEEGEEDDVEDNESEEEKVERLAAINSAPVLEINQRYNRSFKARVIQSSDTIKSWYSQIKNAALSYKGTRSSLSWRQEKIYKGRAQFLKMAIRGKTLCVYFPISVSKVKNIEVEDVSDKSVHVNTPALLRIKKDVHVQQALTLILQSAETLALENGKAQNVDYVKEYKLETTEKLIEEGLIKVVNFKK